MSTATASARSLQAGDTLIIPARRWGEWVDHLHRVASVEHYTDEVGGTVHATTVDGFVFSFIDTELVAYVEGS